LSEGEAPRENEIKLRIASLERARELLARAGARLVRARYFEDNLIVDDGSRSLGTRGRLLRLRRTPAGAWLTYKGPREVVSGVKTREEIEVATEAADALELLLARIGFVPVFRYEKYREVYELGEAEVVIDDTPIGCYLEIEGALSEVKATAQALSFGPSDFIAASYAELFVESGGQGDMVFH
jgi:adenylate cyclase class 2